MSGFNLQISGVGSNRFANCATTTAIWFFLLTLMLIDFLCLNITKKILAPMFICRHFSLYRIPYVERQAL